MVDNIKLKQILRYQSIGFLFLILAFPGLKFLKFLVLVMIVSILFWGWKKEIWRFFIEDRILKIVNISFLSILIATIVGLIHNPFEVVFFNFAIWVLTLGIFTLFYILYRLQFLKKEEVNYISVIAFLVYFLIKLVLIIIISVSVNKEEIYELLNNIFGIQWILGFTNSIPRLFSTHDILAFLIFPLILTSRIRIRAIYKYLLISIVVFFILLSFSRIFWLYLLIVILFLFLKKTKKLLTWASIFLPVVIIFILCYSGIEYRLNSNETHISNNIKLEQIYLFFKFWLEHPISLLIGEGLGSYLPQYIRNPLYPFSYEVQWLAFLYHFGIILIIPIINFFLQPFISSNSRGFSLMRISYLLFLLASFTNPYLISGFSGALLFIYLINNEASKNP